MKIKPTETFIEAFQKLDSSEKRRVAKTVRKLELSSQWLGKRMHGDLHNQRSLRTGHNNRLRIVYLVREGTGFLLIVGERKDLRVYSRAAQILRELGL
jgi:mRNA-degrading endonuclease RelE of RelBE toxin-antitoxin system